MELKIIDIVLATFEVVGSSSRSIKGLGQFSYAYTTGAISLMAPSGNAGHGYQHRPSYGRTVNTRQGPWLQVITWAHHAWELQWPLPDWGGPCGN